MKRHRNIIRISVIATVISSLSLIAPVSTVLAAATPPTSSTSTTTQTTTTSKPTAAERLATIKAKGAAEITQRLASLNKMASRISGLTKLTPSDKAYLSSEVNTQISGLISLQSHLASDTT